MLITSSGRDSLGTARYRVGGFGFLVSLKDLAMLITSPTLDFRGRL